MLPCCDEYQKRAYSYISQAQKLYLNPDETEETTPEKCCENALRLLDGCNNGFPKSVLACEANIWLFASTLKRLRSLHVDLDPLNGSDDLFAPVVPRDAFEPKPLVKLSPTSFRDGFDRLHTVHEKAYRIWLEDIMPRYASLTVPAEKRAAVCITNKLASISLLSSHPFCSLELFFYLWQWSKCATALRWFASLLVTFGFPVTAATHVLAPASSPQADKYGTLELLDQIRRLTLLTAKRVDDVVISKDLEKQNPQLSSAVRCRLESLTSFVDCFALQQRIGSTTSERRSLALAMTRARQYAGQLFSSCNKMETCAVILSLENSQNILDTFWYLQLLLNDALMQERSGKADRSLGLLLEGFSIAFVLCSPYWLMKFTTHLAQLRILYEMSDAEVMEYLLFVRKIFSPNDLKRDAIATMTADSTGPISTPMRDVNRTPAKSRFNYDTPATEFSRHLETGQRNFVAKKLDYSCCYLQGVDSPRERERASSSLTSAFSTAYCLCCNELTALNEAIFLAVTSDCPSPTGSPSDVSQKSFKVLRSKICSKRIKRCSWHASCAPIVLDGEELTAFMNEPLWNLLNVCVLSSSIGGDAASIGSDEIAVVEKAISLLSSGRTTLFSLYYRLTFSMSLVQWKLAQRLVSESRPDVADLLSRLQLGDGKENAPKRGRRGKAKAVQPSAAVAANELKTAVAEVVEGVQKYRHLQFYPWYRWANQLIALLYLPNAPDDLRLNADEWSILSALHFLESSTVSFRHSVVVKENAGDGEIAAKLLQLSEENSLNEALAKLPTDWTVVSLHLVPAVSCRRLILCRLSGRCRPIIVDLGDVISKFDALAVFSSLAQEIDESIRVTEKKLYWARRNALETKLAAVLKQLETDWFGCHRALFCGFSAEKRKALLKDAKQDAYIVEVLLTAVGVLDEAEKKRYLSDTLSLPDRQLKEYLSVAQGSPLDSSGSGPVFLMLDKELHGIPWENMQFLRQHPICRTPCLQYLLRSISVVRPPKVVSSERVFYVVNPSRDLPSTEEYFKWFSKYDRYTQVVRLCGCADDDLFSVKAWRGSFGSHPDLETMKEALASNDVYVYCGHNSGVRCLQSPRRIEQLSCNAAVVLMGCGSAKALNRGPLFEPDAVPFHYLVADSPCVVGCLWSVTAPDIDRYLEKVLKLWLKAERPAISAASPKGDNGSRITSLLYAIAEAKSACKLPLLTGGSIVSFGLPVFCDKPLSS